MLSAADVIKTTAESQCRSGEKTRIITRILGSIYMYINIWLKCSLKKDQLLQSTITQTNSSVYRGPRFTTSSTYSVSWLYRHLPYKQIKYYH